MKEYEKVYKDFWKGIIERNGKINLIQIKKELYDYYMAMHEVSKVYCAITDNHISKITTKSCCVIAEYEDCLTKMCDECKKEREKEL
ncbi:MAG: hypothetical protein PHP92_03910 [Candidatus Nanoarchaeia archaeon]|nr:hypothetical protein [Candidatus Nanoarchaeia archaeon]